MKASECLDFIYKVAKYLKDIKCSCGYRGEPDGLDGRCPECGNMCGFAASRKLNERAWMDDMNDKNTTKSELHSAIEEGISDFYSAY